MFANLFVLGICCRSAAKTKLTADGLVNKLGECSSKWSKSALQVMHQLWTEHGSLVQAHQEVQAVVSIGKVSLLKYNNKYNLTYIWGLKLYPGYIKILWVIEAPSVFNFT